MPEASERKHLATAINYLGKLVSFDTTSRNSNLQLIEWVAETLKPTGAILRLTYDDSRQKANLVASFGPATAGGIALSGHVDTVPVDGQQWSTDPFALQEQDGRLYGRGAVDMKGFLACALSVLSDCNSGAFSKPLHLALSYDEEVGCFGVPHLIDGMIADGLKPRMVIVGEPTEMGIADRHRGYLGFRARFHGQAAHSSDPNKGINAIGAAARLATEVLRRLSSGEYREAGTTFNVGIISGGTNTNIIPSSCDVHWEMRPGVMTDFEECRLSARELVNGVRGSTTCEQDELIGIPPLRPFDENPAIALALSAGGHLLPEGVPFGTEAGYFRNAGIATVVCGPGSILQAHKPDEWIAIDQIEKGIRFIQQISKRQQS